MVDDRAKKHQEQCTEQYNSVRIVLTRTQLLTRTRECRQIGKMIKAKMQGHPPVHQHTVEISNERIITASKWLQMLEA